MMTTIITTIKPHTTTITNTANTTKILIHNCDHKPLLPPTRSRRTFMDGYHRHILGAASLVPV